MVRARIAPCLWFDREGEEAAKFYTSIFKNSRILSTSRYTEAGQDVHHQPAGKVMTVEFELDGQPFTALNAGPLFRFNESISFQVRCETQEEIDYYWEKLGAGGDPNAQQCGWLKDRFGVSWQVVPAILAQLATDPKKAGPVMTALLKMKKLDLAELERAATAGQPRQPSPASRP